MYIPQTFSSLHREFETDYGGRGCSLMLIVNIFICYIVYINIDILIYKIKFLYV